MSDLLHEFIGASAARAPDRTALVHGDERLSYRDLEGRVRDAAAGLLELGLGRSERVGVYLEKRVETVVALYGAAAAGGSFVPLNPLLKPAQVGYVLRDCGVRVLVTSAERLEGLRDELARCPELRWVVLADGGDDDARAGRDERVTSFARLLARGRESSARPHRVIDADLAAILYTSGSTGAPKGVVLTHRNLVAGARSVVQYLGNTESDRILAALPLSFDYGLSQLSTAFLAGATAVLMNYLLARDVVRLVERERISGLGCVPTMWIALARLEWPEAARRALRYVTNSGGAMPRATLRALRERLPGTRIYLMYGLTEAFRSTYLPPEEVDRRPDSIGKAIPNAEVMVVRPDGTPCAPQEPGELVHRGALVAQGYWNDAVRTAERFRPAPGQPAGLPRPEIAVWSGDTVRADEEGFLYFVGRRDEMIKTSGYRVSPSEVEEVVYQSGAVAEAAAIGVPHPELGEAVVVVASAPEGAALDADRLLESCRQELPGWMVPLRVVERGSLPRNPNGKIDRKTLAHELRELFASPAS